MSLLFWMEAESGLLKRIASPVLSRMPVEHYIRQDMSELPEAKPGDVVLSMGTKALAVLQALKIVPKNRTVTSLREHPFVHEGVTYLVSYSPAITEVDYARLPEVQWDIQLATRIATTGNPNPKVGDYRWVESFHELVEKIEAKYEKTGKPVDVSCDLETKGLDEFDPKAWVISIFFTVESGKSDGMYFERNESPVKPSVPCITDEPEYWEGVWEQINWILTSPKVSIRGANFKYDMRWMSRKWVINCSNHKFDTTLVGSLLDENRSNSLKLHAKLMTELGGYEDGMDKHDFGSLEKVPKKELLIYAGGDTDATLQVADHMRRELLKDKALTSFYVNLLHPASHAFQQLEMNGILVDDQHYEALDAELRSTISSLESGMLDMIPAVLRAKYADKIASQMDSDKFPLVPTLLKDFLFTKNGLGLKPYIKTAKTGEPSITIDHLMMFSDNEAAKEFIGLLKEHRSAAKTLSTYVTGFRKHLRSDGRFHPSYMLFKGDYGDTADSGADTGRTSCKDPAAQTIPKHTKWTKKLRRAFIAPPGYNIIQLDFSQGELRIAAILAEEPTMLDAYLNNKDLHAITAAGLNGYEMGEFMLLPEDVRDELRSGGKAGNFGLLYGMGADGFRTYALNSYGVKMTEEESHQKRDAFFSTYSKLPEWHRAQKNYARKWGFVRSPLGRIRHLPLINVKDNAVRSKAERQSVNSPVQATLSDMMQLAMAHIHREFGNEVIKMFLMTHDSLTLYVPLGEEALWAKRLKDVMENLPLQRLFGWNPPLKFVADAEAAVPGDDGVLSFANLKKMKNL